MCRPALIENDRQITPDMPALSEENRHDGNNRRAIGDLRRYSGGQIRRHEFEKRKGDGAGRCPAQLTQTRGEAFEGLSPANVAGSMREQHDSMRSHHSIAPQKRTG